MAMAGILRMYLYDTLNRKVTVYRCRPTHACTYVRMYVCTVRDPLYIYACNYQSKVSIAGTFTALSSVVIAKVRKLSFWCC